MAAHEGHPAARARPPRRRGRLLLAGPGLHPPDHPAAGVHRPVAPLRDPAVAAPADDGAARRARARRSRSGAPARRGSAEPCCAAGCWASGSRAAAGARARPGCSWLGLAAYGVALGMVDASTNMQAVALEHRYGRPILPSFHGAWTLGGLVGAALTLATAGHPAALVAALVARAAPLALPRRRFLPPGEAGPAARVRASTVPWRPILLVGLGLVLFYMVDTAATTWGPTYLDHVFDDPVRPGRAGDVPLPAGQRLRAARRRPPRHARTARCRCCGSAPCVACRGPRRRRVRADLAGGGARLHAPRRRRRGDRAAELLRRGPDRGRRRDRPGGAPGPGGRGDRAASTSSTTSARCSARC